MKRLIVAIAALCLFCNSALCQDDKPQFSRYDKSSNHISPQALNLHFNKQISRYLSGSEDMTMNKTFAILDNEDDILRLGLSVASKSGNLKFIRSMMQLGVQFKSEDDYAEIFNSENEFAGSAGVFWKGTLFSRGFIKYSSTQTQIQTDIKLLDNTARSKVDMMQDFESKLNFQYQQKYADEVKKIEKEINGYATIHKLSETEKRKELSQRKEALKEKYEEEYMEKVQEKLVNSKYYVSTSKYWLSFDVFIPVTKTKYAIAEQNTTTEFDTIGTLPFSGELIFSYLHTRSNGTRFLFTLSPGAQIHNTITKDELKKTSFQTFVERDTSNSVIEFTRTKNDEVYVGQIKNNIIVPKIEVSGTVMFGGKFKFVGLSTSAEYKFDSGKAGWYWKWGIPFNLPGKDDETKVNFEPIVKWDNKSNDYSIGISVGLPMGRELF